MPSWKHRFTTSPDSGRHNSEANSITPLSPKSAQHNDSTIRPSPIAFHSGTSRDQQRSIPGTSGRGRRATTDGTAISPRTLPLRGIGKLFGARNDKKSPDNSEQETGKCATCGGKCRYPKDVTDFRCPVCAMVNTLASSSGRKSTSDRKERPDHAGQSVEISNGVVTHEDSGQKPSALGDDGPGDRITIEGTQKLLEQCIRDHLMRVLSGSQERRPRSPARDRSGVQSPVELSPRIEAGTDELEASHGSGDFSSPLHQGSSLVGLVSRKPLPGQASVAATSEAIQSPQQEDNSPWRTKDIFKPVENYLARTYGNCQVLNASFTTTTIARPKTGHRDRSHDPNVRIVDKRLDASKHENTAESLPELDGKMLLLGNFAENGAWWTGPEGLHSPTRRIDKVHPNEQPPSSASAALRINFQEAAAWYKLIYTAGMSWCRDKYTKSLQSSLDTLVRGSDLHRSIDAAFAESRLHLQRTLLKITENLLKRPGSALKTPDDIRFVLIVLLNPLLHVKKSSSKDQMSSSKVAHAQHRELNGDQITTVQDQRQDVLWDMGHPSALIKRVLGILSSTSDDCHRVLTAYFNRLTENDFRGSVDLVQSFIAHRVERAVLSRSPEKARPAAELVPELSGNGNESSAQLHAALGLGTRPSTGAESTLPAYSNDWQIRAAARVMSLLFMANRRFSGMRSRIESPQDGASKIAHSTSHDQLLPTSHFYNSKIDYNVNLVQDYDIWESKKCNFAFCQFPILLSIGAKIKLMDHDTQRQMTIKAREAFFESLVDRNRETSAHMFLKVRRNCLIEDSFKGISEVVGAGQQEFRKGLRVHFIGEEGVDAGGLRKEWFLLLVRDIFNPDHGMFIFDDDSRLCYFNPYSFETSDQFFLVGVLLGLAIYNSTILDVALPSFLFKKLLRSANASKAQSQSRDGAGRASLADLAEYRPQLARGLKQLLDFEGNVEEVFCRDFTIDVEQNGALTKVDLLGSGGDKRPVTNANRQEFVDLYVRYLLDISVTKQFEPFKRGFSTVCGGNALSLFQPEEIELLVRGSDERLDVSILKAVATYENWRRDKKPPENPESLDLVRWFWDYFEVASPAHQRRILLFITGSDRIPAVGAASLVLKICYGGKDGARFPIARTCFNMIILYRYESRQDLVTKLDRAVMESEGFGLK
ncbi:hypothetical protein MRB53_038126 [Persea americana]|nr:hypothetical protein MRB53_038126 [Persea americana]